MNKKLTTQKRIRTENRNYLYNCAYKSSIKTIIKKFILSVKTMTPNNVNSISYNMSEAFSRIDKSVKCKVIHKNKAARKKAFLSRQFKIKYKEIHH